MESAGTSINYRGELTIYFKHKDKIAYAIKEPYRMVVDENAKGNLEKIRVENENKIAVPYGQDATLVVTSKDKKSISSIVLKNGDEVLSMRVGAFYGLKIDGLHPIEEPDIKTHRKWHMFNFHTDVNDVTSNNTKLHLYNVTDDVPPTSNNMAFTDDQINYLKANYGSKISNYISYSQDAPDGPFIEMARANTPGLQFFTTINGFYYFIYQATTNYGLVHDINTTHSHHYQTFSMTNNPSAIRALFTGQ